MVGIQKYNIVYSVSFNYSREFHKNSFLHYK